MKRFIYDNELFQAKLKCRSICCYCPSVFHGFTQSLNLSEWKNHTRTAFHLIYLWILKIGVFHSVQHKYSVCHIILFWFQSLDPVFFQATDFR